MCGICGYVARDEIGSAEIGRIQAVNTQLYRRGPDGAGDYHDRHVLLGMRRLSIIDLAGGWQPLFNEDRSLALIANAEIYNFIELRRQLESKGHHFRTGSDCETIVHLYEERGADCVAMLRGMFAFALWDGGRRRLLLARDRMGEKPLYLFEQPGGLLFASELKALLASGLVPFELDAVAVDQYFHYQYVPEPRTPIKGVRKLDAGHVLTVEIDPWQATERRYWAMEDAPPLEGDPAQLIRAELEAISELVIRADVPVGVALSGGLDSSAIATLASRRYPGTMHAFSVGYPGRPRNDERQDAQALADHLRMPFHEVELETSAAVGFFPELVYLRDDPIADISGYGYYAVSRLAREHGVPVILQGQGADELFWGYPWVRQAVLESTQKNRWRHKGWRALPEYLRSGPSRESSGRQAAAWKRRLIGLSLGWQRLGRHRRSPADQLVFYDLMPDFGLALRHARKLYGRRFAEELDAANPAGLFTFPQPWPQIEVTVTGLICSTYLRENGLAQGDRLSMASSVELRLPLVDYRLVETVVGLRKTRSDVHDPPKRWFVQALTDLLPVWVAERPKRGFTPPVREWHEALFRAYGQDLVDGDLVRSGVLSERGGRELAAGPFPAGAIAPLSFKALVLEQWSRRMRSACRRE